MSFSLCSLLQSTCFLLAHEPVGSLCCFFPSDNKALLYRDCRRRLSGHIHIALKNTINDYRAALICLFFFICLEFILNNARREVVTVCLFGALGMFRCTSRTKRRLKGEVNKNKSARRRVIMNVRLLHASQRSSGSNYCRGALIAPEAISASLHSPSPVNSETSSDM